MSDALAARGRCAIALSRGAEIFRHLASAPARWEAVDVIQVDERAAPDGSSERNLTDIERELCANVAGHGPRVHPMPVTGDLEAGAAAYVTDLEETCGTPPVLDVVHLGLGADGHTASLVPGDPVLDVVDRPVAVTRLYEGYRRMTLTYPALDAARCIVFVVSGPEKARAVAAVRAGDTSAPAARIGASDVRFFCDAEAAAKVENSL
jgi:6-phosphogluconolactonase